MKRTIARQLVGLLRKSIVHMNSDDRMRAESYVETAAIMVMREFGFDEMKLMVTDKLPVCTCTDSRGWSTCGMECQLHPPIFPCVCDGKCPECKKRGDGSSCAKRVALGMKCVRCSDPEPRKRSP
jgi:hypothetical protein